jgi:hypothetical protein
LMFANEDCSLQSILYFQFHGHLLPTPNLSFYGQWRGTKVLK